MTSPKSKIVMILLCLFLGVVGAHRYYAGKLLSGLIYTFTGGLCGIGVIIDLILIVTDRFRDSHGLYITA